MTSVRVILGLSPQRPKAEIGRLFASMAEIEVIGISDELHEFVSACQQLAPDCVVLDTGLSHESPEKILAIAGGGAQLPALLLTGGEGKFPGFSTAPIHKVETPSEFDLVDLRARLHLLASRSRIDRRSTRDTRSLASAIAEARTNARRSRLPEPIASLVDRPLDLVLILGDEDAARSLLDIITRLAFAPVPILLAVEGAAQLMPLLEGVAQVPVRWLVGPRTIRAMEGLTFVDADLSARIDGEVIQTSPGSSRAELVRSMHQLGERGLTIMLSRAAQLEHAVLREVAEAGGLLLPELDPPLDRRAAAPEAQELAQLLGRLVPRRQ